MKKTIFALIMALAVSSLVACADKKKTNDLNIERAETASVSARVEDIDLKTRLVTLRNGEGQLFSFFAGKEVVNLPQVRVGDTVTVAYANVIKVRMAESGEYWDESLSEIARAVPGTKPGAIVGNQSTFTATIEAIDKGQGTVSLRMPDGELKVVKAKDPANLDKAGVGDKLVITTSEAVGITVD